MTRPSPAGAPRPLEASGESRAALAFLSDEVLPILRRAGPRPLVRAVTEAIAAGDARALGKAPERLRRDLLEVIERHVARSRRGVSPRAVVALTAALMADALPEADAGRRLASPAR